MIRKSQDAINSTKAINGNMSLGKYFSDIKAAKDNAGGTYKHSSTFDVSSKLLKNHHLKP
jgi:hypothetical protein